MIKKIQQFIEGVKTEMSKVSWPTHQELVNSTMIVFGVSAAFTVFIFISDLVISKLIELFY